MAAVEIEFHYSGVRLPDLEKARPELLRTWASLATRDVHSNFREGHDPDGNPWKPLHPLTVKHRQTRSARILYERGDLFRSVVSTFMKDAVQVASNLPYASVHNEGARITTTAKQRWWLFFNLFDRKGNPRTRPTTIEIPKRQFLGIGPRLLESARQAAEDWLARTTRG